MAGVCHRSNGAFFLLLLAVLALAGAARAENATPPAAAAVDTSAFEAAAAGMLYIGDVFGEDNFLTISGTLSSCDIGGYAHDGDAALTGIIGNLTLTRFPVSVSYVCGKLADPRWMPQVTVTGKGAARGGDSDVQGNSTNATLTLRVQDYPSLNDFEISMVGPRIKVHSSNACIAQ